MITADIITKDEDKDNLVLNVKLVIPKSIIRGGNERALGQRVLDALLIALHKWSNR